MKDIKIKRIICKERESETLFLYDKINIGHDSHDGSAQCKNQNIRLNIFAWFKWRKVASPTLQTPLTEINLQIIPPRRCFLLHWEIFYENKWFSICKIPFEAEQDESAYCEAKCYFQVMIQTQPGRKFFMLGVSYTLPSLSKYY